MDYQRRKAQIANSFYNLGLEKARMRDLSGAAHSLKDSLHFNKYQTDARNLLGLIYYESGEVADALVQWVISLNLQPENNLADHYLDEIQRKPGQLEVESQNVKTFNQALWHAQNGSDDLAILQLARVVEERPHFIKAHLLLALLYMRREDYTKAGRSLYKILQIDKSNSKALYYMSIVKQNTGRAEAEKKRMTKAFSHKQMEDDDIILPPTYKENTGISIVIHIVIGLVLGVVAAYFLILPTRISDLNRVHYEELISYSQQLNNANQQIQDLESQNQEIQTQADTVQAQLDELQSGNTSIIAQYKSLIGVLQSYRAGDLVTAALSYAQADFSLITDEEVLAVVNDVQTDMTSNVYQTLVTTGVEQWNAGNTDRAMECFQASLALVPDNPEAMYYVGRLYQDAGDTENANAMFDQVVGNFPDSEYASRAQSARGY